MEGNAEKFKKKFNSLSDAAVGVMLVRTREPLRAIEVLKQVAHAENGLNFKSWGPAHGWVSHPKVVKGKEKEKGKPNKDGTTDFTMALEKLDGDTREWSCGIYCMLYPHLARLNANPVAINRIKEFAHTLTEGDKRLVLLVTPQYELPPELEDDVAVLDFAVPSHGENRQSLDRVIDMIENHPDEALKASPEAARQKVPSLSEDDRDSLAHVVAGMTEHEAQTSFARAFVEERHLLPAVPASKLAARLHGYKAEVVRKADVLSLMEPIKIDQVGGLDVLKSWLLQRVDAFEPAARDFGVEFPRGITLAGPPGTGKSLVAQAVAGVLGQPLVRFDVSRVFQSLVGSSEGKIRSTLAVVESMSPLTLLLDELDKVFGGTVAGLQGDSGVGQRVLGTILTWLQESKAPAFVVATANRIEYLPPELLRKGRMDEVFYVGLPNAKERAEILAIHLRKRGYDPAKVEGLEEVALKRDGYSGAEMEAAIKEAFVRAWALHKARVAAGDKKSRPVIDGRLIDEMVGEIQPLSASFPEQVDAMEAWARNNAKPASRDHEYRSRQLAGGGGRAFKLNTASLDG